MKLTKKVFWDLAIFMIGFGVIVGIVFPWFTALVGVPEQYVKSGLFIVTAILAGIFVGLVNYWLSRAICGSRIKRMSYSMTKAYQHIKNKDYLTHPETCLSECMIPIDSEDEIGESAESFNNLIHAFLESQENERSIREFTEIFTNELDFSILSNKALDHLINFSGANAGMIVTDQGGYLEVASSHLIKDKKSLVNNEIIKKCFETGSVIDISLSQDIKIDAGIVDFYPKTIIALPIVYANETIGVLLLASANVFLEETKEKLLSYSKGLALGMRNAMQHDKLQKLAVYDYLTKVYNRRFGMTRLSEEFARAIRTNYPFGLMMIDIDKFKSINDTYGHLIGDKVLVHLCRIIENAVREGDIIMRYGGEEFLIIVPGASLAKTQELAEKIRRIVEENVIKHDNQEIRMTISIGVSAYPDNSVTNSNALVQLADENLYQAKETGRNKVVVKHENK